MANNGFTLSGATPNAANTPGLFPGTSAGSTSPYSTALNRAAAPAPLTFPKISTSPVNFAPFNMNTSNSTSSGVKAPVAQPTPGLIPQTGAVKKVTVGSDGSHTTEFHPPDVNPNAAPGVLGSSAGQTVTADNQQPQPAQPPSSTSYPGLIGGVVDNSNSAAAIAANYGKQIADAGTQGARAAGGYLTTELSPVAEGNAAVITNTTANIQNSLAKAEEAALQGTGQQQTGLLGAAGLVPDALRYGGAGGTSGLDPATQADQLAKLVTSGQMDAATAETQMAQYGAAGTPALRNAILKINPSFNFNLSESSSQTQATGQALQTSANTANQALDKLSTLYNSLPPTSQNGLPGVNATSNFVEGLLGSSDLSAYKQTLTDARAQIEGVLTATGAATPTGAEEMAQAYLPDNMTPQQLQANIANARTLIQQKVDAFTQSGQQNNNAPTNTTGSGSLYSF